MNELENFSLILGARVEGNILTRCWLACIERKESDHKFMQFYDRTAMAAVADGVAYLAIIFGTFSISSVTAGRSVGRIVAVGWRRCISALAACLTDIEWLLSKHATACGRCWRWCNCQFDIPYSKDFSTEIKQFLLNT